MEVQHNRDGLLEKLPGWNFIEWSAANEFIRDVNYPTNMLWAAALDVVARVYARPELSARAAAVRDTVRWQSWDGEFFVDNAVYAADGSLQLTQNRTEVCQYYAFYFGLATPQTHARLWERLSTEFGPRRRTVNPYPEIHFANAIVGNYLRLELLSRHGRTRQVAEEMKGFFLTMAEATGTLWEHTDQRASCTTGSPRMSSAGSPAMSSASSASTRRPGPSPCAASIPCPNGAAPRCRWKARGSRWSGMRVPARPCGSPHRKDTAWLGLDTHRTDAALPLTADSSQRTTYDIV